jgi:molecular chaperone Hsp33
MENDYLLIAVDSEKKYAIRFLSLNHAITESLALKKPSSHLAKIYVEFLLASTILGSRLDEQEAILFKLNFSKAELTINCEVNPRGAMRSAIFPADHQGNDISDNMGFLKVVRLNKGNEVYESIVEMNKENVNDLIRKYLEQSVQSNSLFFINADLDNPAKNYALWIEKLPDTSIEDWERFKKPYERQGFFQESFVDSDDPDVIVSRLFADPISILAVTKPKLTCACSKERILDALKLLPNEDLVDIFMEGKGVTTQCDYCQRVWEIQDEDVRHLMNVNPTLH